MAEIVATSLLKLISDKLASTVLSQFALQIGLEKELRKLKRTFLTIQDVLEDAEAMQVKEKAVRSWLSELKDLAFEADDVLDDFAYRAAKMKKAGTTEKVRKFLSLPKSIAFKGMIALRVKEINERLDEIAEVRSKFHLKEGTIQNVKMDRSTIREETSSFINESEVYGRVDDKEKIVEFLINTSIGGDIDVMGIVGLGGLGKTTLAGLVYNDERVCKHFEKKMWVCVSEEFEIERLVRLIIESATGREFSRRSMDAMEMSLVSVLKDKRFLLILDDVWSESHEKWNRLRDLLIVGAEGSKVIVTTRNERVASIMGTTLPYKLSTLSSDDCTLLFERRAFGNGVKRNPDLVMIGKEIVKKCGGVPLAAKALSSLLRFKRTEGEWIAIRDSELWKLSDDENYEILPALKLSYDHLSSDLKQCFVYCSIFPKDYEIDTRILIKLWGAEGFLKPSVRHARWEQIGLQYVDELLARSLFQKSRNGWIKMHDLVHDLAQSIAGDECLIVDIDVGRFLSQNPRYAYFFCNEKQIFVALQSLRDTKKLRTFYSNSFLTFSEEDKEDTDLNVQKFLDAIPSNFNLLRAVHFCRHPLKALPNSFKKLKHLRYLNLSNTSLEIFPPCIATMHNLQTLILQYSKIKSIPDSIENLHNLSTLDLGDSYNLSSLPASIGRLECLEELNLSFSKIKLLPESICALSNLHTLNLAYCHSIQSLPESICALSNLHTLNLECCFSIRELPQNLSNMKSLVHLDIFGCYELRCMPENLKKLNQLRTLPIFIPGGKTGCSLTELGGLKLEGKLSLKNLQNVRSIEEAEGARLSDKHSIQSLQLCWDFLYYKGLDDNEDGHVDVKILLAKDVLQTLQPSKSLTSLTISAYFGRTFPSWMTELSLPSLVHLNLRSCNCEKLPALGRLPLLRTFGLSNLPLIKHLGSDFYGGANAFPSLEVLCLTNLKDLEEWSGGGGGEKLFPCLKELFLMDCPKLKALPSDFSSVDVRIENWNELKSFTGCYL